MEDVDISMPTGSVMQDEQSEHEGLLLRIRLLGDGCTELGILAENAFKEAAEALFGQEWALARSVRQARDEALRLRTTLHAQALALLAQAQGQGESMRRIVELEQAAADFCRIAEHAAQIADHAQSLGGSGEHLLSRAGVDDPAILRRIIRQTYLQVRGAVIVCATRDTARARLLAREDGTLDELARQRGSAIDRAIHTMPLQAYPLQQLVLVGMQMAAIGDRVVSSCQAILFTRPPLP
jgi:phosphate uptake regulator